MQAPTIVPESGSGQDSDSHYSITAPDENTAREIFRSASARLLDVNNWHKHCGKLSAVFQLTDEKGENVSRPAQLGDHFRINIPGPDNATGSGDDWVQIEAIEENENDSSSTLAIRVRPTDNPKNDNSKVAHFFSSDATSTFSVTKEGLKITAAVNGRNEKANIKTGSISENIRNAIVAAGAILGLNKPQWKSLVKGLLEG